MLVLDVRNSAIARDLAERLSRRGITPDRVELRNRLPLDDYFKTMRDVDIALDTTPYSGATTALNTLWMGVPVVGLRGRHSLSRGCFSVLKNLDLPELTADSPNEYVAINVRLAGDAGWRRHFRSTLRERMRASALMNAPEFVRSLEAGYRMMWRDWCLSARPREWAK
jgi:predicted O-linked N-acetylglucosamine transferase (SPINDLY family)